MVPFDFPSERKKNEANKGVQGTAHKVRCPLTPDVGNEEFK